MRLTRRQALFTLAGGCGGVLLGGSASEPKRCRLGIVTYALGIHEQNHYSGRHTGLSPALAFLEECHRLGAGGMQYPLRAQDAPQVAELRRRTEKYEMHFEAILDPPRDDADVPRFDNDVRLAKAAGATIARTVIMPGRRYERFKTLGEFHEFEARGLKSLQWSAPVLSRHQFRLAVENHKDQLVPEKLALLKKLGSEWIGLCVDVANNFALMEDPLECLRAFAPFAFTVHLKDMAAKACADGWLLADVALGDGFLELPAMVSILRAANPKVTFNLETITREAIKWPVRTDAFWATIPGPRPAAIERAAAIIKARPGVVFPENPANLPLPQQLDMERRHVERSLAFARDRLNI
jgi:3-oxoisoapionate decarboxylase